MTTSGAIRGMRILPGGHDWLGLLSASAGRHVRLERLDGTHASGLWRAFAAADPSLWRFLGYGPFAEEPSLVECVTSASASKDPLFFACMDVASDAEVGWAAVLNIRAADRVAEIGHLAFSPSLQRTPASTEVTYLLLDALFAGGCRRVEWKCDANNGRSRQAARRLGFAPEGVFRQHMIVKDRNRDTAWFSMLDSEWPSNRAAITQWLAPDNFDAAGVQRTSLALIRANPSA